jgi:hypothetical protein
MSETVPKSEQEQPAQLVEQVEQESKAEGDGQEVATTEAETEAGAEEAQPEPVTGMSSCRIPSDNSSTSDYPIAGPGSWTNIAKEDTRRGLLELYCLPAKPRDDPGAQAGGQ